MNTGLPTNRHDNNTNVLVIDPTTPTTLYAGLQGYGVFKSTDGGNSWSAVNTGLTGPPNPYVRVLALDPSTPTTLYAGTSGVTTSRGGVFKSTDGGNSWSAVTTGLPNVSILALAIDPATPTTLYVGTNGGGVFKSTNGGNSWSAMNIGLPGGFPVVDVLVIASTTPTTLYAGTGGGVFKSTDGGNSWSALPNAPVGILAIDPITPTTLYAGTSSGVFKSTDGGSSWSAMNTGLTDLDVLVLAIAPATPTTLYAGTFHGGVFAITFQGSSCVWGLYIDDHHSGGAWESRLFLSNIDTQNAHNYDVVVLATDTVRGKSLSLGPSAIVQVTCDDMQACGTAGGLSVRSDAPVLAATLFVINTVFGGGAFTAETPQCQFGAP